MRKIGDALLFIVGLIAIFVLFAMALYFIPADNCQRIARAMNRPYIFDSVNGCYVQTVQGNWQRIDGPNQYQP